MEILKDQDVARALELLKSGEVIGFPTETVYGLAAPIFSKATVEKIFKIKRRPLDNPLIAHISDMQQLEAIVSSIPEGFYPLSEAFFPGPLTVILPAHPSVPKEVTAGLSTIGVRMPSHPLALELIAALGEPIVAPSANHSGRPSATSAQHVINDFEGELVAVLDGGVCPIGVESTVLSLVDPDHPILYRPGGVTRLEIEEVLGKKVALSTHLRTKDDIPLSPGLKYRHYAPMAQVIIFHTLDEMREHALRENKKSLILSSDESSIPDHYILSRHTLFHLLRLADLEHYEEVLVFCDLRIASDEALMNRLQKAASEQIIHESHCT